MNGITWYSSKSGDCPFLKWLRSIDKKRRALVHVYLLRVAKGGSRKNVKYLQGGVWEIKIFYRDGAMRVYFGKTNGLLVLLGGSKTDQKSNIKQAKKYWREYVSQKNDL